MRAVPVLLVFLLAACGGGEDAGSSSHPLTASLGREYVLGFGETLHVEGGLSLEFTTLAEDSRRKLISGEQDVGCPEVEDEKRN